MLTRGVTDHEAASYKPVCRVVAFPDGATTMSVSRAGHRVVPVCGNARGSCGNRVDPDTGSNGRTPGAVFAPASRVSMPDYSSSYAVAAVILICLGALVAVTRAADALPQLPAPHVIEQQDQERRPDWVSPTLPVYARSQR